MYALEYLRIIRTKAPEGSWENEFVRELCGAVNHSAFISESQKDLISATIADILENNTGKSLSRILHVLPIATYINSCGL